MDFLGNTFAAQGQGTYMLYLEQKIHGKNFHALLKPQKSQKFSPEKLYPFTVSQYHRKLLVHILHKATVIHSLQ